MTAIPTPACTASRRTATSVCAWREGADLKVGTTAESGLSRYARQLCHVNSRVRGAKVAEDLVLIVAAEAVT